jgi:hypothetical protein
MSTLFKIERGVKLPKPQTKYPLRRMKVGDSFFMPTSAGPNAPHCVRCGAAYVRRSIRGFRVSVRKVKTGHRVWRIA